MSDRERCPTCGHPVKRGEKGPWGKARQASGLSVRQVVAVLAADGVEVSASTISRLDYDASALTLGLAGKLAKVYGVTLEAMVAP